MTFAEGVLRLVRVGAQIDRRVDLGDRGAALPAAPVESDVTFAVRLFAQDNPSAAAAPMASSAQLPDLEFGFADIEAAVGLVETGIATRVVLANFPSWPGLLWRAYELAQETDVQILPTVVRPGGKVDIVIARNPATDV